MDIEEIKKKVMRNEYEISFHAEKERYAEDITIFEKVVALLNKGEGIFAWTPSLREWLKDPDYVFWLGAGGLKIGT